MASMEHATENGLVEITVDGALLATRPGIPLAHALYAAGIRRLRHSTISGSPRGMFCGMGVCFECTVMVNGEPSVRACMVQVEPGMVVETGA